MRNIHFGAVYHMPWLEYRHAMPDGRVCLRLKTAKGDFSRVIVRVTSNYDYPQFFQIAQDHEMSIAYQDEWHDFYELIFEPRDLRLKYLFVLQSDELTFKLDAAGLHAGADAYEDISEAFAFAYAYPTEPMPEWARGCVGYQIFPDRFCKEGNDSDGIEPWTSDRVQNEFRFGGNIRGIIKAVPYLKDLGVKMVYTTPLFVSDSSHRYNTFDYFKIDPLLGREEDLKELCDELHKNDMRIVMDGVFNHAGTSFEPFVDAKQKGKDSEYYDWFFFDNTEECGYQTFGHWPYMPKLNLENEGCAQYFLEVGNYWMRKCHIDGWRLDVSPEVWPDFWRQYRKMMKKENPDSLMIAECWDDSREWVTQGDMFDSTMHYVLSRNIWNRFCFHKISTEKFDHAINRALMLYPKRTQDVLWTFLGSHDTARVRTRAGGDIRMLHAASFFQFTHPGTPIIYYGDELGMEGGDDPYCRFPMRWDQVENNLTHRHYQKLATIRQAVPALRVGSYKTHAVFENGLYAYIRKEGEQQVLCLINTSLEPIRQRVMMPKGMGGVAVVHDLYSDRSIAVEDGTILASLKVGEGLILI
ncbi:MAG: glycoside hydrolase family 13 protein [Clostridiales bacterium]|nr:glycoside hydrolase family 13 protein [Clostridiales bacterium]